MNDVVINGIDGTSGSYLTSAYTIEQIANLAQGKSYDDAGIDELRARFRSHAECYGVPWGVDPQDLGQAGWGVLFAHDAPGDVRAALRPLLEHRAKQAGELYKEYVGSTGHLPDDTARGWLVRRGVGLGQPQPRKVPYYLLIVGDPERIPFRFQSELKINYAVGRLHFDTVEEFCRYAQSVVEYEMEATASGERRVAHLFGVKNNGDLATELSADHLVVPLAAALETKYARSAWAIRMLLGAEASKANLVSALNSRTPPALLFTACHGLGFPKNHPLQVKDQGALLCQDWPGPGAHIGAMPTDFYVSAEDIGEGARLSGTVLFHFGCFGVGTPKFDEYIQQRGGRRQIAERAFLARLPQRMLSLPRGGALAVIGHVERTWEYSFRWPGIGSRTSTFENCLAAIMDGSRVGVAMESFTMLHADLAVSLNGELEDIKLGAKSNATKMAMLWTANNDARNYAIVGDPAVRLG